MVVEVDRNIEEIVKGIRDVTASKDPGNTSILRLTTDNSVIHQDKDPDRDNVKDKDKKAE